MKKVSVLLLLCCVGCSVSDKEVTGIYLFKNKIIIDSLVVLPNDSYHRIISTVDKKTIYDYSDTWSYNGEVLRFENFLNKTDTGIQMINSNDPNFRSPVINTSFSPTKNMLGRVFFDIDRYNCFKKVSSL